MVIKVQIPYAGPGATPQQQAMTERTGSCLVYTKKRDLVCQLRMEDNPSSYDALISVIKTKGVGGLKAYFSAEMKSKDEILVKTGDVLAEQSF